MSRTVYPSRFFRCSHSYNPFIGKQTPADERQELITSLQNCVDESGDVAFNFKFGLHLQVPKLPNGETYHVVIGNSENGIVYFDENISNAYIVSFEQYFIPWKIDVSYKGENILSHKYNAEGKTVLFSFPDPYGLGDTLCLLPYIPDFAKRWNCKVKLMIGENFKDIVKLNFPEIQVVSRSLKEEEGVYAAYDMLLAIDTNKSSQAHINSRSIPMEQIGKFLLGAPSTVTIANRFKPTKPRIFKEPYVCIGVQTSIAWKGWHYPDGWRKVVDWLKKEGYRVFCIDQYPFSTFFGDLDIEYPDNAESLIGDFPLMDRINVLAYADFFIGLGSGLSWLSYAVGIPVVMIVGFTLPWYEFETPYRVQNYFSCMGCYQDVYTNFWDLDSCPYKKKNKFICSRSITPRQVISTIKRLQKDIKQK